jgi:hypothetical protein
MTIEYRRCRQGIPSGQRGSRIGNRQWGRDILTHEDGCQGICTSIRGGDHPRWGICSARVSASPTTGWQEGRNGSALQFLCECRPIELGNGCADGDLFGEYYRTRGEIPLKTGQLCALCRPFRGQRQTMDECGRAQCLGNSLKNPARHRQSMFHDDSRLSSVWRGSITK